MKGKNKKSKARSKEKKYNKFIKSEKKQAGMSYSAFYKKEGKGRKGVPFFCLKFWIRKKKDE